MTSVWRPWAPIDLKLVTSPRRCSISELPALRFLKVNGLLDESNRWDEGSDIRILKGEDNQASFAATYDRFLLELLSFSEAGDDLEMLKGRISVNMRILYLVCGAVLSRQRQTKGSLSSRYNLLQSKNRIKSVKKEFLTLSLDFLDSLGDSISPWFFLFFSPRIFSMISACFEAAALCNSFTKGCSYRLLSTIHKLNPFRAIVEDAIKERNALSQLLFLQFSFHLRDLLSEGHVVRRLRATVQSDLEHFEVDDRDRSWSLELAIFGVHRKRAYLKWKVAF